MNDTGARAWPTTADGTTDWERVFEDPSDGLIVLACRSETPDQLKTMTLIILRQLLKRKNDDDGDNKMAAYIDRTIPDGAPADDMDGLRAGVARLFRRIKDDRIKLAAAYVENKKAGEPPDTTETGPERRTTPSAQGLPSDP